MTRVVVDCFGIRSPIKGIARIGRNVVRSLAGAPPAFEFVLVGVEDPAWEDLPIPPNVSRVLLPHWPSRTAWYRAHLPRVIRTTAPDIVHGLSDLLPSRLPCPGVVTVTEDPRRRVRAVTPVDHARAVELLHAFRSTLRRSSTVITISAAVADDLSLRYQYPRSRIRVAHPGLDYDLAHSAPVRPPFTPYFLCFGTGDRRERLPLVLSGFHEFRTTNRDAHLAVVGLTHAPEAPAGGVRPLGRVSDAQLAGLYRSATALVDMSEFEGFGFQILEACHYRTPIIASSLPTVIEIAGESAITTTQPTPGWLAQAMRSVTASADAMRPVARVSTSWEPFMAATYDAYATASTGTTPTQPGS